MSTRALQLGQLFYVEKKFAQTTVNVIFDTKDLYIME